MIFPKTVGEIPPDGMGRRELDCGWSEWKAGTTRVKEKPVWPTHRLPRPISRLVELCYLPTGARWRNSDVVTYPGSRKKRELMPQFYLIAPTAGAGSEGTEKREGNGGWRGTPAQDALSRPWRAPICVPYRSPGLPPRTETEHTRSPKAPCTLLENIAKVQLTTGNLGTYIRRCIGIRSGPLTPYR